MMSKNQTGHRIGLAAGARRRTTTAALLATLAIVANGVHAAEFEPERLKDGVALPADMPRLYVSDFSIGHLADGRVYVLDARNGKFAGMVDAGYAGAFTTSPDGKRLYVAATYMTRHTHGDRHDMVEIYDADTLRMVGDVAVPNKKAQGAFMHNLLMTSFDGRYLFLQNATPATSVTVVDLQERKVVTELPSPGCYGIYPSQTEALRISMLCGDGKLATVTMDAEGKVTQRAVTRKFFDSGDDPVYVPSPSLDGHYYFVTFHGGLHKLDLRGAEPVIEQTVSFVTDADRKQGWRPGGYQAFALDKERNRLLVGMHPKGAEGTHKFPAQEIWTVDLATGKRVARTKSRNAIALQVGGSGGKYLYALNGATNQIVAYALPAMREAYVSDAIGEAPLQVDAP